MPTNLNVQYNIPRVQVQLPGRQNRLMDGVFRITPSMTEPVIFIFGNQDGVPLNMVPFEVHFVVWLHRPIESETINMSQSNMILNKRILVQDPYAAQLEMILSEADTIILGSRAAGTELRWSLFMINDDGEVFPTQVSNSGGRFGTLHVDLAGNVPIAELIRSPQA